MSDDEVDGLLRGAAKIEVTRTGECLDDEVLLAYRRRTLPPEKEEAVEAHVATCASCRQLLAAIEVPLPDLSARRAKEVLRIKKRSYAFIAAAAAVLLALGATIALVRKQDASLHYTFEGPLGGIEQVRGEGTGSKRFDANGIFRLIVRPEHASADRPAIALFVARKGENASKSDAFEVTWTELGTAELSAPANRLFGAPGTYSISCVVGSGATALGFETEAEYVGGSP